MIWNLYWIPTTKGKLSMFFFGPKNTVKSVARTIAQGVRTGEVVLPEKHWFEDDNVDEITEDGSPKCNGPLGMTHKTKTSSAQESSPE